MAGKANDAKNQAVDDLEILESLKNKIYNAIMNDDTIPKVGDLLKIIEMKNKLDISGQAEKQFWDLIEQVRQKGLPGKCRKTTKKEISKK